MSSLEAANDNFPGLEGWLEVFPDEADLARILAEAELSSGPNDEVILEEARSAIGKSEDERADIAQRIIFLLSQSVA